MSAESGSKTSRHWLVTYGDLMSLLLVLFVYLFASGTLFPRPRVTPAFAAPHGGLPSVLEVRFDPQSDRLRPEEADRLEARAFELARLPGPILVLGVVPPGALGEGGTEEGRNSAELAWRRVAAVVRHLERVSQGALRLAAGTVPALPHARKNVVWIEWAAPAIRGAFRSSGETSL